MVWRAVNRNTDPRDDRSYGDLGMPLLRAMGGSDDEGSSYGARTVTPRTLATGSSAGAMETVSTNNGSGLGGVGGGARAMAHMIEGSQDLRRQTIATRAALFLRPFLYFFVRLALLKARVWAPCRNVCAR